MKQNIIIGVIVAIVVVSGIAWYVSQNKASAPESNDNSNTETQTKEEEFVGDVVGDPQTADYTPTSATVAVSTQVPGDSVTVDNAFLDKAGFVVIHEANATGQPGNVVGSSGLLSAGAKQDLEISAPLKAGAKYIAMLYVDNGDKKFTVTTDTPVKVNDIALMTLFSVSQ